MDGGRSKIRKSRRRTERTNLMQSTLSPKVVDVLVKELATLSIPVAGLNDTVLSIGHYSTRMSPLMNGVAGRGASASVSCCLCKRRSNHLGRRSGRWILIDQLQRKYAHQAAKCFKVNVKTFKGETALER